MSNISSIIGTFFFSAALTAQNSPELHFRFINHFIQSSLLRSLIFRFQAYLCVIMEVGGAEDIAFESVVAETFAEILAVNTVGTDSDYDDLCLNQFGVETFVFP